jgi:hypothetical protein
MESRVGFFDKGDEADSCAKYLLNNKKRLKYDEVLAAGFPIASGIIEGACRHLINDRLDIIPIKLIK